MALKDCEKDMMRCNRCSYCKVIPHQVFSDSRFLNICPSIEKYNFHGWSAGGRQVLGLSLLYDRVEINDAVIDMVYQCQMCGGCDVSCKVERDREPYEAMQEIRFKCVESGQVPPDLAFAIESLKKEDNMMGELKKDRGNWAEGVAVKDLTKEKAEVLFHAGCRYSFDESLWPTVKSGLNLLVNAGVDVGIMEKSESCCGGRSYEMGYAADMQKFGQHNVENWKNLGVKTVVTPCADCYQAFKVLYDKLGYEHEVEILHITEYIHRLIKDGTITFTKEIPLTVTYHDPCHLGRLADPWIHWNGKETKAFGQMVINDPPKEKRFGTKGVYDIPREILRSIPGVELKEMPRIREYAYCCGGGGGVKDAYPEFSESTAANRLEEARSVEAEALVSSCPWCKSNFTDAANGTGDSMKVFDIIDLVHQAI